MPNYHIQHRIRVLLSNNTNFGQEALDEPHTFTVDGLTFRPWVNDPREYWRAGEWLVETNLEMDTLSEALKQYSLNMSRVVPRIAFVGQAYINDRMGSIFIKREDKQLGWFRSIIEREPVPLDFMDEELEALKGLLEDSKVPDTFYLYWNDAVNTASYTAKLLLMFGAIDSFAPRGQRQGMRKQILGEEFANEIYTDNGLRNRLTHGDYLNESDGNNYVELVHKKVLEYFNSSILGKEILELDIVGPQRHFDENYEGAQFFVKQITKDFPLDIHSLVEDAKQNEGVPHNYEIIHDVNTTRDY